MNPWHELGLDESATADDIRRAYRRLAAEHHPDRNPGDESAAARFQRVRQPRDAQDNKDRNSTAGKDQPRVLRAAIGAHQATIHLVRAHVQVFMFGLSHQNNLLFFSAYAKYSCLHYWRTSWSNYSWSCDAWFAFAHLVWPHQMILSLGMGMGVAGELLYLDIRRFRSGLSLGDLAFGDSFSSKWHVGRRGSPTRVASLDH